MKLTPWMGIEAEKIYCREKRGTDCSYLLDPKQHLDKTCFHKVSEEVAPDESRVSLGWN